MRFGTLDAAEDGGHNYDGSVEKSILISTSWRCLPFTNVKANKCSLLRAAGFNCLPLAATWQRRLGFTSDVLRRPNCGFAVYTLVFLSIGSCILDYGFNLCSPSSITCMDITDFGFLFSQHRWVYRAVYDLPNVKMDKQFISFHQYLQCRYNMVHTIVLSIASIIIWA